MILSELIQAIEPLQVIGKTDVNVHAIQFDSRKVEAGDLFVAQAGTAVDGHTFIPSCVEKGASVIVLDNSQYLADTKDGVTYVLVKNSEVVRTSERETHTGRCHRYQRQNDYRHAAV